MVDYNIFRGLAFVSGNPIYGLILNGLKRLYIDNYYFLILNRVNLAYTFYYNLTKICKQENYNKVLDTVRDYGKENGNICREMKDYHNK